MFNLSGSEIIVILLLALVVLGPEKLPEALRRAGRTYAELKKMGNSFQSEMRNVIDEPVKEMRETADLLRSSTSFTDGDPQVPGSGGRAVPAELPETTATVEPAATTDAATAAPADATAPTRADATTPRAADATAPSPTDATAPSPVDAAVPPPVDATAPPTDVAGPADDEALINRTLSGESDPPAGSAGP